MANSLPPEILNDLKEIEKTRPLTPKGLTPRASKTNGHATDDSTVVQPAVELSSRVVAFHIGDEIINVPEMTWDIIEEVMPMMEETPPEGSKWYQTKVRDFEIFLKAARSVTDITLEELKKKITLKQANEISVKLLDLLALSGFTLPGEVQATVTEGSTETLIVSSPESSPEDVEELQSGMISNE
jgi:hypothetical protein